MGIHSWFHSSSSSTSRVFLAAMITIFIILSTTGEAFADDDQAQRFSEEVTVMGHWCNKTTNIDVCNSLTATLKNGTLDQANRLVILGLKEKVKLGMTRIDSAIFNNTSTDILIKRTLEGCRDDYNTAIKYLKLALKMALKMRSIFKYSADYNDYFHRVDDLTKHCDHAFNEMLHVTNPVKDMSDSRGQLIEILYAFTWIPDKEEQFEADKSIDEMIPPETGR